MFDAKLTALVKALNDIKGEGNARQLQLVHEKLKSLSTSLGAVKPGSEKSLRTGTTTSQPQIQIQASPFDELMAKSEERQSNTLHDQLVPLARTLDSLQGDPNEDYLRALSSKLGPFGKRLEGLEKDQSQLVSAMQEFEDRQVAILDGKWEPVEKAIKSMQKRFMERQAQLFDTKLAPMAGTLDTLDEQQSLLLDHVRPSDGQLRNGQSSSFVWEIRKPKSTRDRLGVGNEMSSPPFYLSGLGPFHLDLYPAGRVREQEQATIHVFGSEATGSFRFKFRVALNGVSSTFETMVRVDDEKGAGRERFGAPWPASDAGVARVEVELVDFAYFVQSES